MTDFLTALGDPWPKLDRIEGCEKSERKMLSKKIYHTTEILDYVKPRE
jgi:hypothetical protein